VTEQDHLLTKDHLKTPAVILFGVTYIFAAVMAFLSDPLQALVYLGMSLGILLLVWLILDLTKKLPVADIQVKRPGLELAFGCLLFLIFEFAPDLHLGDKWTLGEILKKEILYFALPLAFLKLRGNSLSSMGLSLSNWKQNLRVAGAVLACMTIPCVFLIGDAAKLISGGQVSLFQALPAFLLYFIHNVARSGLPEEFFYRAFVQTRLSQMLRSRLGGILITSLLFGLVHIPNVMRWNPGMALFDAFCSAFFMQGFIGLIFGVLWDRTHNLISGVLVHSGINTLTNLGAAASLTFQ
jgi:membrane protease YdiL (CAAX protease family)